MASSFSLGLVNHCLKCIQHLKFQLFSIFNGIQLQYKPGQSLSHKILHRMNSCAWIVVVSTLKLSQLINIPVLKMYDFQISSNGIDCFNFLNLLNFYFYYWSDPVLSQLLMVHVMAVPLPFQFFSTLSLPLFYFLPHMFF